jgi:hypothetical protein
LQKGYNPLTTVTSETSTARNPMMQAFRQRSSLYALSYFMLNAMDVKEKSSRITSNSTFKPPPRVTLTEQKKETWLRDLADPSVPLRRLSRTIPHGTRNRSLLEQCCNKNIPIARAVWFARCVGANELRGLKRKGSTQVGSVTEVQWIYEWTEQVTEFIEKVIKECPEESSATSTTANIAAATASNNPTGNSGTHVNTVASKSSPSTPLASASALTSLNNTNSPSASSPLSSIPAKLPMKPASKPFGSASSASSISKPTLSNSQPWKVKMEYITRLAANLFSEGLLDKPLFLKWCIVNLQKCRIEELPVAILFIRLFWDGIVQSRLLSQNLALALLERFSELSSPTLSKYQVFVTFKEKVSEALFNFFIFSPDSFVIPQHWKKLGPVLIEALKGIKDEVVQQVLELICMRNESLTVTDVSATRASRNPKYIIIDALDKANAPYNWSSLLQSINVNKIPEQDALMVAFEWATSKNRAGVDRVYICASMLTEWHNVLKWDISAGFLNFLDSIICADGYDMKNLYDMVSELQDRDWFSAGTFFRRLISQGTLFISKQQPSVNFKIKILANLPVQYSTGLRNQQIMMLRNLKVNTDKDHNSLLEAKSILSTKLSFLFADKYYFDQYELFEEHTTILSNLSKVNKMVLSTWVTESFNLKLSTGFELSVSQFAVLQNVFEILSDFKALYVMIERVTTTTTNGSLLYFMANSTCDHLAIFAAIADVVQLIQLFVNQYKSLNVKTKMSKGLWDLINFALKEVPESNVQLRSELEQIVLPTGQTPLKDITTLSPMSDIVNESIVANQELSEFLQERLGTHDAIDNRSLPKFFDSISEMFLNACKQEENNSEEIRKVVALLQHLKDTDPGMFSELAIKWIKEKVEPEFCYDSNSFTRILLFLVIYECVTLEKIAETFLQMVKVKVPGSTQSTKVILSLISEDYISGIQLKASEKLALNMQRHHFAKNHGIIYLKYILQEVLDSTEMTSLSSSISTSITQFLLWFLTHDLNQFISQLVDPILHSGNTYAINELRLILLKLLKIDNNNPANHFSNAKVEILYLLEIFNPLNLALCQVYVRVVLVFQREQQSHTEIASTPTGHAIPVVPVNNETILGVLMEVIASAHVRKLSERALGDLMVYLPEEIKSQLLMKCELLFIQSPQFPCIVNIETGTGNITNYLLEVIDAIAASASFDLFESHSFEVTEALDKLLSICDLFTQKHHQKEKEVMQPEKVGMQTSSDENDQLDQNHDLLNDEASVKAAIFLFVKILVIHSPKILSWPENIREKVTNGIIRLLSTQFVVSRVELYNLLADTLESIKSNMKRSDHGDGAELPGSDMMQKQVSSVPLSSTGMMNTSVASTALIINDSPVSRPSLEGNTTPVSVLSNISPAVLTNSKLAHTAAAILNHSGNSSNDISSNNNSSSAGIGNVNLLTAAINPGGFMGDESDYLSDLILYNKTTKTYSNLNVRAFDLLEESNHTMQINDVALNLAMFDGFIEKKNPV